MFVNFLKFDLPEKMRTSFPWPYWLKREAGERALFDSLSHSDRMRVRQLQTHLQETNLVNSSKLSQLQGLKIGLDAAFWLRSIQKLKDPFADALGGIPPGLFGMLDRELEQFKKHKITPVAESGRLRPSGAAS